jgi:hypothetical protein
MDHHKDLWYIIGGELQSVRDLMPEDEVASTPLHAIDSIYGQELFCNPWGTASESALTQALRHAEERALRPDPKGISLDLAVKAIAGLQEYLETEMARGSESQFIRMLIDLKGYPISEVQESVQALGAMVHDLQGERALLGAMLGTADPEVFLPNHDVIPRFGLVASGNLGLFETVTLIWSGVLAQTARNGGQFSLTIKPSMYDYLFHDLICLLPQEVRIAFSRITWRSEAEIIPDSRLIAKLVNNVDGAIYFGNRRTLHQFRDQVEGERRYHHFYYDHFPIMILLPALEPGQIDAAAKLATDLAHKARGEACLSLQDVFVHQEVYDAFVRAVTREWRRLCSARGDPWTHGTQLASYAGLHLEQLARLRDRLDGALMGQVYATHNQTDLIVNHELEVDNWVLSTENAAPLLCIARFSDVEHLIQALRGHLQSSSSDKFIYTVVVTPKRQGLSITLYEGLASLSHRIEVPNSRRDLADFQTYAPGVPHCGGISFLADMLGLPHGDTCYLGRPQ